MCYSCMTAIAIPKEPCRGLFDEVLRLERKVVYARGYKYSRDFTTKLLKSLELEGVEDAERIKTDFLGGWRE